MRSKLLFIRVFSLLVLAVMAGGSAFAQGKGGGKGGKHEGGPPGQHRGGEKRGGGEDRKEQKWGGGWEQKQHRQKERGGGWEKQQRQQIEQGWRQQAEQRQHQMQQWQQAQRQQREAIRQQQMQQREWQQAQRQQHKQREWQQREWQQSQRHQQREWQQAQRDDARRQMMEQRQWRKSQRHEQKQWRKEDRDGRFEMPDNYNWGHFRRQQAFEAKRQRDLMKAERHAARDAWKYARKQQHFEDKAYRRAERDAYRSSVPYSYPYEVDRYWSDDRGYTTYQPPYPTYPSYTPSYPSYGYGSRYPANGGYLYSYDDNYYYDYGNDRYSNNNAFFGGFDWKEMLFRTVIAAFFSNRDNVGYFDPYPQYRGSYYNDDYRYPATYSYYPYYTFGSEPALSYYEPAAYYGYDQFSHAGLPYEYSQFSSLPYNDIVDLYSGGLAGELIQRALVTGYYQGLLEGQAAQRYGWDDEYYDPYAYDQAIYDPYSSSLGESRRYFSEGYELGYMDALNERDEFGLDRGGDIDLVSLLLTSILDFRG